MKDIIVIRDSNTDFSKEWVILTSFESELYKHEYIVVYDENAVDDNGDVELEIFIYENENVYYIEDDEELDHVYELLEDFFEKQEIIEE